MHSNDYDHAAGRAQVRPSDVKRYKEVFTRKIYETRHPLVRVHPESGERSLILGHFVKRFVDVGSADARHLFDIFQSHIVRHEKKHSAMAMGARRRGDVGQSRHTAPCRR